MSRLDNIVARNRRPNRLHERVIASTVIGAIILLIIGLAVFTDLGLPPDSADRAAPRPPAGAAPSAPAPHIDPAPPDRTRRVDGILLRTPHARPAQP